MPRSLRQSAFRRRADIGEDVNPSAYIVNLADCMLVLACGFMVALIAYWNVDISTSEKVDESDMSQVAPETIPDDVDQGGSGYVEAGKVYRDAATGELYLVPNDGESVDSSAGGSGSAGTSASSSAASQGTSGSSAVGGAGNGKAAGSTAGSASSESISDARAGGAD